jgi:cytochrome aa3-600 menaquinol oxidase subunit 4
MKELFPRKQIMGYLSSLMLTTAALTVYYFNLSFELGSTILVTTALVQAAIQLIVFMHAGQTEDRKAIYTSIVYGVMIAIVTIFGSLLALIWGYY